MDAFLSAILDDYVPAGETAKFAAAILEGNTLNERRGEGFAGIADDILCQYNPDEPRDEKGRWTTGGETSATGGNNPRGRYTKITWGDFKGKPPADAATGKEAAKTIWNYKKQTGKLVGVAPPVSPSVKTYHATISAPDFQVGAVMDKDKSWYDPNAATNDLLQHEQLHLSIADEYAAIAQDKIRSITGQGIGRTQGEAVEAARKDLSSQGNKILGKMKDVDKHLDDENGKYDKETNHGLDENAQKSWNQGFAQKVKDAWGR
jgi:hypothetical protein